jgi:hypothetical protein
MRIDEMPQVEIVIMSSGCFWGGVGEPTIAVAAPAVISAGNLSRRIGRNEVQIDWDRGTPRDATPPTPPGIRVRTTAVRLG